jgi:hypothetical protein
VSDTWPQAFDRAETARRSIADIIAQVESEQLDAFGAFERGDNDPLIGRTFAVKVLEVLPGVGKVRARRTMASLGIGGEASLASLTSYDRQRIVDAFAAL